MNQLEKHEIDHLEWMYHRMMTTHKENIHIDYMVKFKKIISKLKENPDKKYDHIE